MIRDYRRLRLIGKSKEGIVISWLSFIKADPSFPIALDDRTSRPDREHSMHIHSTCRLVHSKYNNGERACSSLSRHRLLGSEHHLLVYLNVVQIPNRRIKRKGRD